MCGSDSKKHVLIVGPGPFVFRGVESFLINVYKNINHDRFSIDFLTPFYCTNTSMIEMVKEHGDNLYELNLKDTKLLKYHQIKIALERFLKSHPVYDAIHINTGNALPMSVMATAAKNAHISKIIVHAHNGGEQGIKHKIIKLVSRHSLVNNPTDYLTCSKIATEYVLPKEVIDKAIFIPNGIDTNKYLYSNDTRKKIRDSIGFEGKIIGTVGALIDQKNHLFSLELLSDILKKISNVKLIIIGEGEKEKELNQRIRELSLENNVILLKKQNNIPEWLSAFDVFIMPSLFEGLPVSLIEAQTNGLPCYVSDRITPEVAIGDIHYLDISRKEIWVDSLLKELNKNNDRSRLYKTNDKFSIDRTCGILESIYST